MLSVWFKCWRLDGQLRWFLATLIDHIHHGTPIAGELKVLYLLQLSIVAQSVVLVVFDKLSPYSRLLHVDITLLYYCP